MASEIQTLIEELSQMQIENAPSLQSECDQRAAQIIGASVRPSEVQGATSYTIVPIKDTAGPVIQFRTVKYAFDLNFLHFIEQTYGERFVPHHQYVDNMGKLLIYMMNNVHGVSAYLARDRLRASAGYLLGTTLQDFAT